MTYQFHQLNIGLLISNQNVIRSVGLSTENNKNTRKKQTKKILVKGMQSGPRTSLSGTYCSAQKITGICGFFRCLC